MKIALIGYGKMGKEIEQIALSRGHSISLKITSSNANYSPKNLSETDVAIEFSIPEAATQNMNKCFDANVPIVVGTTAWYDKFETVASNCKTKKGTLFYATNFSLGVHLFWKLTEQLAQLMNDHPNYQPHIHEIHHTEKLDAPSGTVITTAEKIIKNSDRLKEWFLTETNSEKNNHLPVTAERLPNVPGTHKVKYESDIDIIELTHEAKNRKGFALGSVLAAEYILHKKGIFTMNDLLGL